MKELWLKDTNDGATKCKVMQETEQGYIIKKYFNYKALNEIEDFETYIRKDNSNIIQEKEALKRISIFKSTKEQIYKLEDKLNKI